MSATVENARQYVVTYAPGDSPDGPAMSHYGPFSSKSDATAWVEAEKAKWVHRGGSDRDVYMVRTLEAP